MTRAIARCRSSFADPREMARACIVWACAAALIAAGPILPF